MALFQLLFWYLSRMTKEKHDKSQEIQFPDLDLKWDKREDLFVVMFGKYNKTLNNIE